MDGVHVVDEGLHCLVHAAHGLVDGMLAHAVDALQPVERLLQVVDERLVVEGAVVLAVQVFQVFQLLFIRQADEGCEVEIKGGNGLPTVHLVLGALHRDAGQHACRLDALGRT